MRADTRHHPHAIPLLALAALMLLAGSTAPARAQHSGLQDTALQVLERTDEYLQQVQPVVQDVDSEQARQLLADAMAKQAQARQLYEAGRYAFAIRLSNSARQIASQAERIARGSSGYEERARRALDRLRDLHEQVRERAGETGNGQAMTFVRQAEGLYQRAREQFEQTRYEQAFRLLSQAENSLRQAARLVLEGGDRERLADEQSQVSDLIATARERLQGSADEALSRALDNAEHALEDARLAATADQPLRAMRLTRRARTEVLRILRQAGGGVDAASVQREIDRFDVRQRDFVSQADDAEIRGLLTRAASLRDEAVGALNRGDEELALRTIRSALNVQRQAGERLR